MKELTREELPDDGTHFVVTWVFEAKQFAETGLVYLGNVFLFCHKGNCFMPKIWLGCTNIRYWQFPQGETK